MIKLPPTVKTLLNNKVGKTILSIKQEDKQAVGVSIFRKSINNHLTQIDSKYTFIDKIPIKSGDIKTFNDEYPNFNPVIYRVIPYNNSGIHSAEFSGIVSV